MSETETTSEWSEYNEENGMNERSEWNRLELGTVECTKCMEQWRVGAVERVKQSEWNDRSCMNGMSEVVEVERMSDTVGVVE